MLFLSAYCHNLYLSLYRSSGGEWKDFRNYYQIFISPIRVAKFLQNNSPVNLVRREIVLKKEHMHTPIVKRFFFLFFPSKTLEESDVIYCYNLLLKIDDLLKPDIEKYTIDATWLALAAGLFNDDVLKFRLKPKDFERVLSVEHYWELVETNKMVDFMKDVKL